MSNLNNDDLQALNNAPEIHANGLVVHPQGQAVQEEAQQQPQAQQEAQPVTAQPLQVLPHGELPSELFVGRVPEGSDDSGVDDDPFSRPPLLDGEDGEYEDVSVEHNAQPVVQNNVPQVAVQHNAEPEIYLDEEAEEELDEFLSGLNAEDANRLKNAVEIHSENDIRIPQEVQPVSVQPLQVLPHGELPSELFVGRVPEGSDDSIVLHEDEQQPAVQQPQAQARMIQIMFLLLLK